jgi:hypothetical protein
MSGVFVCGLGAVSPAGWGIAPMRDALAAGTPLPVEALARPGWTEPLRARLVPNPVPRPAFLSHPRLRRTSPITHYAAAAALEAVAGLSARGALGRRLGIVVCLQSGCVQYSYRFFSEALQDPATASPLLFPEIVFAAPASHVAALLEKPALVNTLVGDPANLLQGVALGAAWLEEGRIDACLVVGAEETNWLLGDALWHFERSAIISGGAGALCLCRDPELSAGVKLGAITDVHSYSARRSRARAAQAMRRQLGDFSPGELLCDGLNSSPRADAPERAAWSDWTGPRLSLKQILGEGLMAAAAWQCVAACDAVATGRSTAATVSLVGSNQQAIGARFVSVERGILRLSDPGSAGSIKA